MSSNKIRHVKTAFTARKKTGDSTDSDAFCEEQSPEEAQVTGTDDEILTVETDAETKTTINPIYFFDEYNPVAETSQDELSDITEKSVNNGDDTENVPSYIATEPNIDEKTEREVTCPIYQIKNKGEEDKQSGTHSMTTDLDEGLALPESGDEDTVTPQETNVKAANEAPSKKEVTSPIFLINKDGNKQSETQNTMKEIDEGKVTVGDRDEDTVTPQETNVKAANEAPSKKEVTSPIFFFDKDGKDGNEESNIQSKAEPMDEVSSPKVVIGKHGTRRSSLEASGDEVQEPLANYKIYPVVSKRAIDHEGNTLYEKCTVEACLDIYTTGATPNRSMLTIPWSKIKDLASFISYRNPRAILYDKANASLIETEFRRELSFTKEEVVYTEHGWHLIDGRHMYVYRSASDIPGDILTDLDIPSDPRISPADCYQIWRTSLDMYCDLGVSACMSAISFMGPTFALFDQAGCPPRFLPFMVGRTGSYKTAMALVLFVLAESAKHRKHPRRLDSDTRTSLERGIVVSGRDNVTLIDDFSPSEGADRAKKESDLEAVIRAVGDGSSKSRSNGVLEDKRGEGVAGMVVVTGELKGKGLSSNLRCLYLNIDKNLVNLSALTWLQEHKLAYTSLMVHYINFLSYNWDRVVGIIERNFESYRQMAMKSTNTGRLAETLAELWCMVDVMQDFFTNYCQTAFGDLNIDDIKAAMLQVVIESERIAYQEDPVIAFMRALATMIETCNLNLKSGRLNEVDMQDYDGFYEDNFIYLLPEQTYQKVVHWLTMGGSRFNMSCKETVSALCRAGYAISSSNGSSKRTLYARLKIGKSSKKVNFIKIPKNTINEFSVSEPDFY